MISVILNFTIECPSAHIHTNPDHSAFQLCYLLTHLKPTVQTFLSNSCPSFKNLEHNRQQQIRRVEVKQVMHPRNSERGKFKVGKRAWAQCQRRRRRNSDQRGRASFTGVWPWSLIGPHTQEDPTFGLMLCCSHLEILIFKQGTPHLYFALSRTYCITGLAKRKECTDMKAKVAPYTDSNTFLKCDLA